MGPKFTKAELEAQLLHHAYLIGTSYAEHIYARYPPPWKDAFFNSATEQLYEIALQPFNGQASVDEAFKLAVRRNAFDGFVEKTKELWGEGRVSAGGDE